MHLDHRSSSCQQVAPYKDRGLKPIMPTPNSDSPASQGKGRGHRLKHWWVDFILCPFSQLKRERVVSAHQIACRASAALVITGLKFANLFSQKDKYAPGEDRKRELKNQRFSSAAIVDQVYHVNHHSRVCHNVHAWESVWETGSYSDIGLFPALESQKVLQ